jgi:hypothetical protein
MEIKGFCSDCTIEEAERIFEEQYECSRKEPTTVNVYLDSTSETGAGIHKFCYAVNTFCIFSKEQAIRIAKEQFINWKSHERLTAYDTFMISMKVIIKFDTEYAKSKSLWLHSN